jgi:hypothetical protein
MRTYSRRGFIGLTGAGIEDIKILRTVTGGDTVYEA